MDILAEENANRACFILTQWCETTWGPIVAQPQFIAMFIGLQMFPF